MSNILDVPAIFLVDSRSNEPSKASERDAYRRFLTYIVQGTGRFPEYFMHNAATRNPTKMDRGGYADIYRGTLVIFSSEDGVEYHTTINTPVIPTQHDVAMKRVELFPRTNETLKVMRVSLIVQCNVK